MKLRKMVWLTAFLEQDGSPGADGNAVAEEIASK